MYHSTGGAVYYQAAVLSKLGADVTAIITLSEGDEDFLNAFPSDVNLIPLFFDKTMEFENIYPTMILTTGFRRQMCQKILLNPKTFPEILEATMGFFYAHCHLRISLLKTIEHISRYNVPIYLGAQGYLRQLKDHKVILKPWDNFQKFLRYIQMVFIDEVEAKLIMAKGSHELNMIGNELAHFGLDEVIITAEIYRCFDLLIHIRAYI